MKLLSADNKKIWNWLRKQKSAKLNIARQNKRTLYGVIADACGVPENSVYRFLLELHEEGIVEFSRVPTVHSIPVRGTLVLNLPPVRQKDYHIKWQGALQNSGLNPCVQERLWGQASLFEGMSQKDMEMILHGLKRLGDGKMIGETRYSASANYLLGSSKMLDSLGKELRDTFKINLENFSSSPKYLAVAGPSAPQALVLVENPNSFEVALKATQGSSIVWACTYGFGLGNEKSDQDGAMLEANLTSHTTTVLTRAGSPPQSIGELLSISKIFFGVIWI